MEIIDNLFLKTLNYLQSNDMSKILVQIIVYILEKKTLLLAYYIHPSSGHCIQEAGTVKQLWSFE